MKERNGKLGMDCTRARSVAVGASSGTSRSKGAPFACRSIASR